MKPYYRVPKKCLTNKGVQLKNAIKYEKLLWLQNVYK